VLLAFIGGNMVKEALSHEEECVDCEFGFNKMITLAVATSIDALAVGVVFAMEPPFGGIWLAVSLIGVVTFALSAVGVKIGNLFGMKYKSKAELCGGIVLIGIGIKMLIEGLFF
jgi:putative Mn2+ efflux pump MntP